MRDDLYFENEARVKHFERVRIVKKVFVYFFYA